MVFLPECYDFVGESPAQSQELAETIDGDIISQYKKLASHLGLWLSLGGGHEKVIYYLSVLFSLKRGFFLFLGL